MNSESRKIFDLWYCQIIVTKKLLDLRYNISSSCVKDSASVYARISKEKAACRYDNRGSGKEPFSVAVAQ